MDYDNYIKMYDSIVSSILKYAYDVLGSLRSTLIEDHKFHCIDFKSLIEYLLT